MQLKASKLRQRADLLEANTSAKETDQPFGQSYTERNYYNGS